MTDAEIAATRASAAAVAELLKGPRDRLTAKAVRDAMRPALRERAIRKSAEREAELAELERQADMIRRQAGVSEIAGQVAGDLDRLSDISLELAAASGEESTHSG